ncbi:hypothetical protein [Peptostreptococcus faecalis]|uniref:hypothetical protein n=1 Tax=Peptostreptococcus faecalis TaxID=2045015 RepID=UPI000C7D36A3|nr:hypothetical protein [Peptostreptococcus faecalis]
MISYELKKIIRTKIFFMTIFIIFIYLIISTTVGIVNEEKIIYSDKKINVLKGYDAIEYEKKEKGFLINNSFLNKFQDEFNILDKKSNIEQDIFFSNYSFMIKNYHIIYGEDYNNVINKKRPLNFYKDRILYGYKTKKSNFEEDGYIRYNIQTPKMNALHKYSEKIKKPFLIKYNKGWESIFNETILINMLILLAIFFNIYKYVKLDEASGVKKIINSSEFIQLYDKTIYISSILFGAIYYFTIHILEVIIKAVTYGLDGGTLNIQVLSSYLLSPNHMDILNAYIFIILLGLCSIFIFINILFLLNRYLLKYSKSFLVTIVVFLLSSLFLKYDTNIVNWYSSVASLMPFFNLNPENILNNLNIISFKGILFSYTYIIFFLYVLINILIYILLTKTNHRKR